MCELNDGINEIKVVNRSKLWEEKRIRT